MMTKKNTEMLRRIIGAFLSIITLLSWNGAVQCFADDSILSEYCFYRSENAEINSDGLTAEASSIKLSNKDEVYVGGFPFGVKLYSDGLIIIGFSDIDCEEGSVSPAKDAGMEVNDIITKVNNKTINSATDFINTVEGSDGEKLKIVYKRNNTEYECEIIPSISVSDGKYKTGMWLRDSTAGIGTVTFVNPENGLFAGLGHGICDNETGLLIPMSKGVTSGVVIEGIKKGACGAPGELKGVFDGTKNGILLKNTENGVFGIFSDTVKISNDKIKLGTKNDIKEGPATIICTLDNNKPTVFDITISEIHRESTGNKNFIVNVTDNELIQKTGGIVQGMSGSPIIQEGKLVGAVTHVLINDPTKGYGIFIENMLSKLES